MASPPPRDERPTPEQVGAWLDEHPEASGADVAREFGLAASTARRWVSAHRKRSRPPATKKPREKGAKRVEAPPPSSAAPRAKRAQPSRLPAADELDPDAREQIRAIIDARLQWLADPANIGAKGERDVAIVVGIMADKWGDLLKARDADGGVATPESQQESRSRLRYALGLQEDAEE